MLQVVQERIANYKPNTGVNANEDDSFTKGWNGIVQFILLFMPSWK